LQRGLKKEGGDIKKKRSSAHKNVSPNVYFFWSEIK